MKKTIGLVLISAAVFLSCNDSGDTSDNTDTVTTDSLSVTSNDSDWTSLFDGKSTAGWHTYGSAAAGERWKVAEGAIYLDTAKKEGGDLVTNEEFDNFHLKLEWKIAPKGNSGIIFYTHEDTAQYKATYHTGLEMQVLDNDGHPDGKIIKHRAGDLYDLISCSRETVKPVGEWNEAEIISKDGKLDLRLNGETVVSTTLWDENWKTMVAGSKFKSMPGFGTYKKGHIVLQDHGDLVWYRNIQIKKL